MPVWDGLSPHLLATFFASDKNGAASGTGGVTAPLLEANIDFVLNWQSPFENTGPESMKPSMFAMLQSGEIQGMVDEGTKLIGASEETTAKAKAFAAQFEGRTGLTKLNSIQTFSSMPPIKIQVTAFFRAWFDAASEVEDQVDQLIAWALPQKLADDGAMVNALKAVGGEMSAVDALLPSVSPALVGMSYKGRTYAPLVIENISLPIGSPITKDGKYIEMSIPMTLCTLAAIDKDGYAGWKG
jgi:hypothetical protein